MTRSEIEHARALAETHAPKSTDPLRDATQARSTIEVLPRLTLRLLDERDALLTACMAVMASDVELNARIEPEHMGAAWYRRRLELERRERAALDAVKKAIAKAEAP